MVFDSARGRVVLFGGESGNAELAETWEWDGTSWALRTPSVSPPGRRDHAMAWDASRQRVVLFGGYDGSSVLADTWEWDGTAWRERTPLSGPRAQSRHSMAYDGARQLVVLFDKFGETWEWDGSNWRGPQAAASPSRRSEPLLAYDTSTMRVVLYGGYQGTVVDSLNDTWAWDGSRWLERLTVTSPERSYHNAMATDDTHQRLMLVTDYGTWLHFP